MKKVTLREQLKRKAFGICDISKSIRVNRRVVYLKDVEKILAPFLEPSLLPEELLEKLAELEHEQWIEWSKELACKEALSKGRLERWQKYWHKYTLLSEPSKEHDRKWARKVLAILEQREPSPQTQKLLENLREKIDEALKYASMPKRKAVLALLDNFVPKLEALLTERRKLEKLIEDFPPFLSYNASHDMLFENERKIFEWFKRLELLTKK